MWYKTSEIRATLLVNLAPTRPIIPIAAALSSDKETADKQAWSLPATKTCCKLTRYTLRLRTASCMYVRSSAQVYARKKLRARWTLDRQDMATHVNYAVSTFTCKLPDGL